MKRWPEAEAEFRRAIQLQKALPEAHYNLGLALEAKGDLDEAIAAYREALRLKPDFPEAHCTLGLVLMRQGRFAEAQRHLYRGHEPGSRNPTWPHPSRLEAQRCRRLVELDRNLPAVLAGKLHLPNPREASECADFCQIIKRRYAAAVRLYAEAFDAEPKLGEDLRAGHRCNAALAAALAGCGKGEDAASLDARERARLRQQALTWLQADLSAWRKNLKEDEAKLRPVVRQTMQDWLHDADLTDVRDRAALAQLAEAERQGWQKLWADVKDLFTRTADDSPVPKSNRPSDRTDPRDR